jgi:hypothetical protein
MRALPAHLSQHKLHALVCGVAVLLVIGAVVFGVPVFAALGGLMCAAMMIGMVWMMGAMRPGRHRHG